MTRLLWVSSEVPDLHMSGGSIRQYHLLQAVARQAETHLLVTGRLEDQHLRALLAGITEVIPVGMPYWGDAGRNRQRLRTAWHTFMHREPADVIMERPMRKALRPALAGAGEFDLVQVEHTHLGPLLPNRRSNSWSLDIHQLASRRSAQQMDIALNSRHRWLSDRERQKAERFERLMAGQFDLVTVPSAEDAAGLPGNVRVVPNGVDLEAFTAAPLPPEPRLVFTGLLHWFANVDGLTWFCDEVLPRVRERITAVSLEVVGRNPGDRIARLGRLPGVSVHANVPRVQPHLERARLAIVPLRIGSGTRLKALEAMAAGRPVVGTTIGLEGLGIENGREAVIEDDAQQMAAVIVDLLNDDARSRRIGAAGRALAEARFSWNDLGQEFVDNLFTAIQARRERALNSSRQG